MGAFVHSGSEDRFLVIQFATHIHLLRALSREKENDIGEGFFEETGVRGCG